MKSSKLSSGSCQALADIRETLNRSTKLALEELPAEGTALLIVDMVNGFAKAGALYSPRIEGIIPEIRDLMKRCLTSGIRMAALADSHPDGSPEYSAFPVHCQAGSTESAVVIELQEVGHYTLFRKNSTNGFLEEDFQEWLHESGIDHFIIVGDCTDICIMQLALTLKTHFNRLNRSSRIMVPLNAVETYDLGDHEAELMNTMALYFMQNGGVEIVSAVR